MGRCQIVAIVAEAPAARRSVPDGSFPCEWLFCGDGSLEGSAPRRGTRSGDAEDATLKAMATHLFSTPETRSPSFAELSANEFAGTVFFHLWTNRVAPFNEFSDGDAVLVLGAHRRIKWACGR